MVLCSPDWGAHGGNEYWRNLLDRLAISSVRLPDEAIYVPLGRKTPIGKPGWGSMLSVVDGSLTSIPWEDLDPTLIPAIQRESDGLALGDLKDRLRPQDAVETTPGGDEYVVTDTNAPNSPCHVPVPDGVSECGLSELPSSIGLKVLRWVVDGAGGLRAGKTSGAGTRGVDLNAAVGGRTGYTDTNGGESSNN